MQKKSLLVALFCGALCLTGCLKNEESASVAQVRMGKAAELNSIAKLNEAKAAAEAVYAQAELTVAQAEAKLREANAALVLAQAETEKVRAELLKVRVALAEVKVEEEKVTLQKMEADLEQKLAEVEAAIAKAEGEKQKYINEIEHQVALAEKQAIDDALAILKAEDALQKYLLDQEGVKAENAKAASVKYFAALKEVQNLQRQQIVTKAEKALVEAGAVAIRDAIHFEMEQIDDEIAKKEALVEYLKEHQTMTPEEAEEALIAARTALNEAYNDYKDAQEAEGLAKEAYELISPLKNGKGMTSAFTDGEWDTKFTNFVTNNWGHNIWWWGPRGPQRRYVSYVKTEQVIEYEDYAAVIYYGYTDPEDPTNFIKLWKEEQPMPRTVLYPTIEEQSVRHFKNEVQEMVIAPAEIYYDNIVTVLDSIEARQQAQVAKDVQAAKDASAENVEAWQKAIAANKGTLALHQEYVNARKDTIAKLESELETLVKAYNTSAEGHTTAVEAYQKYMMLNYEVPKVYFENEIETAKDTVKASSEYSTALKNWGDMKARLEKELTTEKKNAKDAAAEDSTTYHKAVIEAQQNWNLNFNDNFVKAVRKWSPVFEGSYTKTNTKKINGEDKPWYYKYNKGHFEIPHVTATPDPLDTTGTSQLAWLVALGDQVEAKKAWDDSVATHASQTNIDLAKEAYQTATVNVSAKKTLMDFAEIDYNGEQSKYDQIFGAAAAAEKAWNPDFEGKKYTDADVKYDATKGEWYKMDGTKKNVAGTAQSAKFMADSLYDAANHQVNGHGTSATDSTLLEKKDARFAKYTTKKTAWQTRYNDLLYALETTKKDYKADPKVAELYEATLVAAETAEKFTAKFNRLQMRYGLTYNVFDPEKGAVFVNYLAPEDPYDGKNGAWHNDLNKDYGFGWIISNYHLNPEFEFINSVDIEDGKAVIKKKTVAEKLYGEKTFWNDNAAKSLTSINARYTKLVADEPASLQETIDGIKNSKAVTDLKKDIADVKAALKKYEGFETEYDTWVENREKAFKAWNEAKKDTYDAADEKDLAQAIYDGVVTLANGGMWVYDPDWKIFDRLYPKENHTTPDVKHRSEDFTWINVNDEIETLEGDTADLYVITGSLMKLAGDAVDVAADMKVKPAELQKIMKDISKIDFEDLNSIGGLNFAKSLLQKALNVGKVTLQYVLDAFDEEIAVLDEKIDLYTKLAATYKAIMNGWLGIVDEAVVEEPVEEEGEGDDEE